MNSVMNWLMQGEPWVVYRASIDLLGKSADAEELETIKTAIVAHPQILALLAEAQNWPGTVLSSHKSAQQTYHKLAFLADIGLTADDAAVAQICEKIMSRQSDEGPFQLPMNIPVHFGGSGQDEWSWALCDAPVVLYSLIRFGYGHDSRVKQAVDYLRTLIRDNGWPCTVAKNLGKFRGPGKKEDPCPYATLVMLKMLIALQDAAHSGEIVKGASALLDLWQNSRERHPYMFYMGTDFAKLKAPLIWYDLLHVLDILSAIPQIYSDPRFKEMADLLVSKGDADGRYVPESVYLPWKEWDFGQKKQPSRWITFLVLRIMKRLEER